MKKFLSICLCAALLTGGFGGGLSAFAAKTSTEVTSTDEILYPASDTPDKINEAGQKAINAQSYTTEDGVDVELPAIEVIRELDFPASKDVSYIRLFYYPHGCTPPAEKFYLITDKSQIETIRQALAQNHHNWAACARMLETDVANLHRLAKRLGLKD